MREVDARPRRPKLVFIAGLTHSGTTLLDSRLGAVRNMVGLGEVVALLTTKGSKLTEEDRTCSCGAAIDECPFWSRVKDNQEKLRDAPFEQRYTDLLEVFFEVFGETAIPVDSSKTVKALKRVASIDGVDVSVLHLVRDVRGWVVSRRDVDLRRRREGKEFPGRLWGNAFSRFLVWYYGNKQINAVSEELQLDKLDVSYESLVFNTEEVTESILRHVDPGKRLGEADESGVVSHILLGNRMRTRRSDAIVYDYRWFSRGEWLIPSVVFPWVMSYNKKRVYSS